MSVDRPPWTILGALACALLLSGCPENQDDDDAGDDDTADDDTGDDDTGDDDTGDDDTADDDTGDDDTVVQDPGPVRVLFVVDTGAFWQCSDSGLQRQAVFQQKVQDLLALSHVAVGYVLFGDQAPQQAMTTAAGDLAALWDPGLALAPASDLQGGLATAVALLQADHATLDPKELPYARYVVVVVSDSVPEPTCTVGCEDDAAACSDGTDNDADGLIDGADPSCATLELYGVCNQAGKVPPGYYVDMSGDCPSYNQPGQLSIHVNHLLALETSPGVGGVTVHTRLVSDPIPVVEKVCALQGHEQIHLQVSALLSDLAKLGGGSFSVAEPGDPFLDGIDYGAIAMP